MNYFPNENDFIDIHSHNPMPENGVFRIYNVFSSEFYYLNTNQPVSIGLHPWHISDEGIIQLPGVLKKAIVFPNLIAIGEAGIDKIINTSLNEQLSVFRTHAEMSKEYDKPLIIHCVKAFPELFKVRKEYSDSVSWIIHGFNGSEARAEECIEMGIYISLSQRLFRNPEKTLKIVRKMPLSMIFAETDDDPVPIRDIYKTISELYDVSIENLKHQIFENFTRIFRP